MFRLKSLLSDPLLHFLVLGALLFAADAHFASPEAGPANPVPDTPARATASSNDDTSGPIVVDEARRASLRKDWQETHGEEPTKEELAKVVEAWIDQQVLFRAGLERGLDEGDPGVQSRIASKMSYVLSAQVLVPEPSEAELRAYFQSHAERWNTDARIDFIHVFVEGKDDAAKERALELLTRLEKGQRPDGLGDRFPGGRRYRGRKPEALAKAFGQVFADHLQTTPLDSWSITLSRHGYHLVQIERRTDEQQVDFASARLDVHKAWQDERRAEGAAAALAELRKTWQDRIEFRP